MTNKDEKKETKPAAQSRILKTKAFKKLAKKGDITDKKLVKAIEEVNSGLVDGDYGGGVLKKRVARQGQGKREGHRVIILMQKGTDVFFVHSFEKGDKEDLEEDEQKAYKLMAKTFFAFSNADIEKAIKNGIFEEVKNDD